MIVLDCGTDAITALAFAPDGLLYAGTRTGNLFVSNGYSAELTITVNPLKPTPINAICHDVNGNPFIAGEFGVSLFHKKGLFPQFYPTEGVYNVTSIGFVQQDRIVLGNGDANRQIVGELILYSFPQLNPLVPRFRETTGVRSLATHTPTRTVAWSTGGKQVVIWTITVYDKWRVSLPIAAPSIAFHPEGRWLAAAQDWNVLPIDTERKQLRDPLKGHKGRVTAVACHPHDGTLYSTGWDGMVRLWEVASGTEKQCFDWKLGRLMCLAIAPDGTRAAAGSESGKVVIWDVS